MIRVNVHFEETMIERLDEIRDKVYHVKGSYFRVFSLTRADLIRFAVAQVFGIKYSYIHVSEENLSEVLKKVLKKTSTKEGV